MEYPFVLLAQSIKHRVAKEDVMSLLSYAAGYAHNDLPMALALSEIAKDKALQMNDQEKLFNVYREKGYYFEDNNKMDKAKEAYSVALECANKLENNSLRQTIYTDLAIVNRKTGNYKKAKDANKRKRLQKLAHAQGFVPSARLNF